jgi:uncharacterized protein (DUF2336 family)
MLTQDKVERLLTDLSSRVRADTAAIVAFEFASGKLTNAERAIALDILTVLASDVEQQVREALSDHLKSCPFLPRELAYQLARDIEAVAIPMIEFSTVLSDEDLIAIVQMGTTAKQLAVARRAEVAAPVADALVDTRKPQVVGAVLENPGAELTETTLSMVIDRHRQDASIHARLVARPVLPVGVAERLVRYVSHELRVGLAVRHQLPPALADEIMAMGQERALVRYLALENAPAELERIARMLDQRGWLTPMLLLRCLAEGRLDFFAAGMATRAGIPPANAAALIDDEGPLGFRSLYAAGHLPPDLFRAFRATLAAQHASRLAGLDPAGPDSANAVVSRLTREYASVSPGDLETVLGQLSHLQAKPRGELSLPH